MIMIPVLDLKQQHEPLLNELREAFEAALGDLGFIGGKRVENFEANFAKFCDAKYCVGVASGTDALYLTLRAMGIGPGDKVVIPTMTFIATAEAVSMTGATPVFADIDPQSYTLDPEAVSKIEDSAIKAVIPVHLYGQAADMSAFRKLAVERKWFLIEDAAQAHGAKISGTAVGGLADAACFSFYPGKNLGALGDAGAVTSNDSALEEKIRKLANHGRVSRYAHDYIGCNARLDALQAAFLDVKLSRIADWNAGRGKIAKAYETLLQIDGVTLPKVAEDRTHVYHQYVIQVDNREKVAERLAEKGVGSGVHYPIALHEQKAYADLGYKRGDFPHTEKLADRCLSLPIFPELTDEQIQTVAEALKWAVK